MISEVTDKAPCVLSTTSTGAFIFVGLIENNRIGSPILECVLLRTAKLAINASRAKGLLAACEKPGDGTTHPVGVGPFVGEGLAGVIERRVFVQLASPDI